MTTFIVGGLVWLMVVGVVWALFHGARKLGAAEEREESARDVAEETKRQAERMAERRTDGDVVDSLRRKAAGKRER